MTAQSVAMIQQGPVRATRPPSTSVTLLHRLAKLPRDESAWADFVKRYGSVIFAWCRAWGLQPADAADVTQETLGKLASNLSSFAHDQTASFRRWLRVVARNVSRDLFRARRRQLRAEKSLGELEEFAASSVDLSAALIAAYEQELIEVACARIRPRVRPHTWEAFRLTTLERVPGPEVSARLGIPLASVHKARANVLKMLKAEVSYLEFEEGAEPCAEGADKS